MNFVLDFKILTEGDVQSTKIFSNLRSGGKASIFSAVPNEHRQVSITINSILTVIFLVLIHSCSFPTH